jgi:hypothetical protein
MHRRPNPATRSPRFLVTQTTPSLSSTRCLPPPCPLSRSASLSLGQVTLPPDIPPSFNGKLFSISYAVVADVMLQGVGNIHPAPKSLHLPLLVEPPGSHLEAASKRFYEVPLYGRAQRWLGEWVCRGEGD